jgi:beta-phosphoglucomutase-like phosphatase (HAD superfamily)
MFGCVIFDFDGTLIELGQYVNWDKVCRPIIDLYASAGIPKDVVRRYSHNPLLLMANTYDDLFKALPEEGAYKILEKASHILEVEEFLAISKATAIPGCEEVLRWLKAQKVHVGLISSNSGRIISYLLKKFKLNNFIDNVVGREARVRMKPYSDQLHLCLERIGFRSEGTALVAADEDAVRAARASGIHVIVVLSGSVHTIGRLLDARTDSIVENLHELLSLFQQL